MDSLIGIIVGALLVWIGYIVLFKKTFFFFAGLWEPVNREKLSRRVGILFIVAGVIAIISALLLIWSGSIVATISGVLVLIIIIMIVISIVLDQLGF